MFTIKNNFLYKDGNRVSFKPTPNHGGKFAATYLIMHYTAATTAESSIGWFLSSKAQASAHLLIDRNGNVTQFAPFDIVTWHAGQSEWRGELLLNDNAIGIEFVNGGLLERVGAGYVCPVDKKPVTDFIHDSNVRGVAGMWQTYTDSQIAAGVEIAEVIKKAFPIKEILGHEDIAPGRKIDPGPAFPWTRFKGPARDLKTTTAVNLREGADVSFKILKVLPKGTAVKSSNTAEGWTLVEVLDGSKLKGWIKSNYIS